MKIKICGITNENDIRYLNDAKVDYAGFVLFEKSKRFVSVERGAELFAGLDPSIKKVAVVVSPKLSLLKEIEENGYDIIQIHGELSPDIIREANIPIWRAFNVSNPAEIDKELRLIKDEDKIEAIVVDGEKYGSGQTFDWSAADNLSLLPADKMFILAGGLNPGNVAEGIEVFKPDAVDVSSGVEGTCGKDEDLIKSFVDAVRMR